jgi:hypothetical protein
MFSAGALSTGAVLFAETGASGRVCAQVHRGPGRGPLPSPAPRRREPARDGPHRKPNRAFGSGRPFGPPL